MEIDPNEKPKSVLPKMELPEAWGKSGHCPACNASPLQVIRIHDGPDYLICQKCEFSFEVAASGRQIRAKNIPDDLGFAESELRFRWVEPGLIQSLIQNRQAILQKNAQSAQLSSLTEDEIWERTLSFHRLGNKAIKIAFILRQAGADPQQIEEALAKLKKYIDQENTRQSRKLAWTGGIAGLVVTLLFLGWYSVMGQISSTLEQGAANKKPAAIIPLRPMADVLPDVIKPGFLKSPSAKVVAAQPSNARCPASSEDAARIFGGKASAWQRSNRAGIGAWQMIDAGAPATIRVPSGMVAGYIDNVSFMFYSANGPATIRNVNFLAITCE
ncbi:MAG: hypothetical protein RBS68_00190 [Anaerolineales bacterium]|jgi:hypothetical protein|nr:hypothetical protein [Anaerolineales bacterium]